MRKTSLMPNIAEIIEKIDRPEFPASVSELLGKVAPHAYTVFFGYLGTSRPLDLYDNFPKSRRQVFVEDYQNGPYLLDPFFLAATKPVPPGLYRMRDLAPDRFYQGEYFRSYYDRTGLAEEIGYFVDLPGGGTVVLSLMRDKKQFSNKDILALEDIRPVISACVSRHWSQLSTRLDVTSTPSGAVPDFGIERTFQSFGLGILTPREREIVEFTLKGHSPDAMGRLLGIAPGTVRIHRRNIYAKLQIKSQGELFSRFIETLGQG